MTRSPSGPNVRSVAGEGPDGGWEVADARLDPWTRRFVRRVTGFRESASERIRRQPVVAGIPIIVGIEATTVRSVDGRADTHHAFVAGVFDHPVFTINPRGFVGVQLDLTPRGVCGLLGVRPTELANTIAGDLRPVDSLAARVQDQLADDVPLARMVDAVLDRVAGGLTAVGDSEPVFEAWRLIESTAGRIPMASVAHHVGWSAAHMGRAFRRLVGIGPKQVARYVRFEAAAAAIGRTSQSLADVAVAYGYSDQSHLTRECSRLAGCSPATLRRELRADSGATAPSAVAG